MPTRRETNTRASALRARFEALGAEVVEPPLLQSADMLLDLYGEDIRARAYVTTDALRGEQMLRPDFTVPVVQMHMATGAEPARYTYAGEVFRRQEQDPGRASEYVQVGYEVFDRESPAEAEAEVFALIQRELAHLPVHAMTGDIGLLMAAVQGLNTTERRKAALMRHIWRPNRFRQLLNRFAGRVPVPQARLDLLSESDPMRRATPNLGKRSVSEIAARIEALHEDALADPISEQEIDTIDALLKIRATVPIALGLLRDLAENMPTIRGAVDRLEARTGAMAARRIAVDHLEFETSFGRTSMEYYDGFVFGFLADGDAQKPALASGGRYDALTRRLGHGREIPAVGGVLRPDLMLAMEAAS